MGGGSLDSTHSEIAGERRQRTHGLRSGGSAGRRTALVGLARRWPVLPDAGRGAYVDCTSLTPSVLDGQTPEQLDRVVDRWQRMLSGVDSRTRLYFYLLRRPIQFENQGDDEASSVAALGRRKRQAFLEKRVQSVSAYVAWAHDPGLSAVTTQKTGGPWWMAYAKNWMARRRNAT